MKLDYNKNDKLVLKNQVNRTQLMFDSIKSSFELDSVN